MKKHLTACLFIICPFFCLAQTETGVLKQFEKNVKGIVNSVNYSEHVKVILINRDDDNFDVVAVDDNLQELWRLPLKGSAFGVVNFNGKLLAIAATEYSNVALYNNTFKGFLIDGKT